MPKSDYVYPNWVQQFRTRGTTIKKKDDNYYLYKRTSKRVSGKKYPQPVDTYIGVITPDGVIDAQKKIVPVSAECEVFEYGFSRALQEICPEEWKTANGENWQKVLLVLIRQHSELSFLQRDFKIPDEKEFRVSWSAQYSSLIRKIYQNYKVERYDLDKLKNIFVVYIGKTKFLSRISEEQQHILDQLHISNMEVR